jgi:hypothetical protein
MAIRSWNKVEIPIGKKCKIRIQLIEIVKIKMRKL